MAVDPDEEIREIKREIIESRGLVTKTNNLVASLAGDLKAIARRQAGYERRFTWNSGTAYVLFAVLCFVGVKLASDARVSEIEAQEAALRKETNSLRVELGKATEQADARQRAESRASSYYADIQQGRRRKVVDAYETLREERLSPAEDAFFRDTVEQFRTDLSVRAYHTGMDRARTGKFADAVTSFEEALRLGSTGPHVAAVKYELARALERLRRNDEALVLLEWVLAQDVAADIHDDALFLRARCFDALDRDDEARDALRAMLRRFPRSPLAPDAREFLRDLFVRSLRRQSATPSPPQG